ncbi:DUF2190 family protein [Azospirillum brasilense]|uniref:DUF2190 family protein n=1 Tax=Azospirillum brasilense TaxID=192 RepID=UPI001EDA7E6D|nr:DUF2190 family protein [Azospirillum brasilense]UKJ74501.1 DUF2190 family protein [Azospirillum brasilense]
MRNFIKSGKSLDFVAPTGGVTSGDGFVVGNFFAVAHTTAPEGESVSGLMEGVVELPKRLSQTFASGSAVSWDVAAKRCDGPGSGKYPIGGAVEAAGNTASSVIVRLNGTTTSAA